MTGMVGVKYFWLALVLILVAGLAIVNHPHASDAALTTRADQVSGFHMPLSYANARSRRAAVCIRHWESRGNYRAQNPYSTASGAYQFVNGTWRYVTGGHYSRAKYAPHWVQDRAFLTLWANGRNASHWVVRHRCGY